jgi:hypothetical protein
LIDASPLIREAPVISIYPPQFDQESKLNPILNRDSTSEKVNQAVFTRSVKVSTPELFDAKQEVKSSGLKIDFR